MEANLDSLWLHMRTTLTTHAALMSAWALTARSGLLHHNVLHSSSIYETVHT